jgi:hypothetical protein
MVNPDPDKLRAARAWAKAYNNFEITDLEPLIDEKFCYSSMWVLADLEGRDAYLDYLRGKLKAIRNSNAPVTAEIAETRPYPNYQMPEEPCVYVRQDAPGETREAVVLFATNKSGMVTNIWMNMIPLPSTVFRTGEIPR